MLPLPRDMQAFAPRKYLTKGRIQLLLTAAVLLAGVGGWFVYQRIEPEILAGRSRKSFAAGNHKEAVLTVRRALQMAPNHLEALDSMADICQSLGSPAEVGWRRKLVELQPGDAAAALALAAAALHDENTALAEVALSKVPVNARDIPGYHLRAADVAVANARFAVAQAHYQRLIELEPKRSAHRLKWAVAALRVANGESHRAALQILEELTGEPAVAAGALRALVRHAMDRHDGAVAWEHSRRLVARPTVEFSDRMVHLHLLKQNAPEALPDALEESKAIAATKPEDAAFLIAWMNRNGASADALTWIAELPEETRSAPEVAAAHAACFVQSRAWAEIEALVSKVDWRHLDYLGQAFRSLAVRERGETVLSDAYWQAAVSAGRGRPATAKRLFSVVNEWGWKARARELLWATKDSPGSAWALQTLYGLYAAEKDTASMHRVLGELLASQPDNHVAQRNFILTGLLLGKQLDTLHLTARELHEKNPQEPIALALHAYSMHLRGETEAALRLMDTLPIVERETAIIAPFYATLLKDAGEGARAQEIATKMEGANLLPEQRVLLRAVAAAW